MQSVLEISPSILKFLLDNDVASINLKVEEPKDRAYICLFCYKINLVL